MEADDQVLTNTDPTHVSKFLLKFFKETLKPNELKNTVIFVQKIFEKDQKQLSLEYEILSFLEIAQSKKWLIEMPLWCLCRTFKCPKDEIFAKEVYEIHVEVENILKKCNDSMDTLGELLDQILELQQNKKIFKTLNDLFQTTFLLQISFETTVKILFDTSKDYQIMDAKILWFQLMMNKLSEKYSKQIPLSNNTKMLQKFLSPELQVLHDLLDNKLQSRENLIEFEKLLQDFNEAELSDEIWMKIMSNKADSIKTLNANIIFQYLQNDLQYRINVEKENDIWVGFSLAVINLFAEQNWNLKNFQTFLPKINSFTDLENFVKLLNLIYEYDLKFEAFGFENFPSVSSEWLKYSTKIATKQVFSEKAEILKPEEIIKLIAESSTSDNLDYESLSLLYEEYLEEYNNFTNKIFDLPTLAKEISDFRNLNALEQIKKTHWLFKLNSRIAAAVFAINYFFRIQLRPVQILTILISMEARKQKFGKLLQVPTGEGKTMIIAAIAIIEAINGIKVDIVTSSTELAVNQYEKLKQFYKKLGFIVQHNANGNASNLMSNENALQLMAKRIKYINETGKDPGSIYQHVDEVYEADILYGDVEDYLADILQTEFMDQNIRHDRKFELVIVDEVDSMMIDGRNDSVRLSTKTPGMNDLLQVYTAIWSQLRNIHSHTKNIDGIWYYSDGENLKEFDVSVESFARNACLSYLKKMLRFEDLTKEEKGSGENWDENISIDNCKAEPEFPKLEIPEYLREYVKTQLPKWIDSAINAMFNMRPGFDYVLKNGQIVVVDASNTGAHHPTMRWSDGLHQFLQMKHGCYLEPEALATNYMSKVTFFQRYGTNILGLTGTIGGESSRKFLDDVYNVKFVDIPSFKGRRHYEMVPFMCASKIEWIKDITDTTASKLNAGRAVLIITNYIDYAEQIANNLRIKFGSHVLLYIDREGSAIIEKEVKPGQCIVATNIAGRGTDLLISDEVEKCGGLHVLLTFLPENDRVERQNIGRTSRTESTDYNSCNSSRKSMLEKLRNIRDQESLKAVEKALEEVKATKHRDEAFEEYMEIRKNILKHVFNYEASKSSLDTIYGKYLRTTEEIKKDTVIKEFKPLMNAVDVITNPYDAVKGAVSLLGVINDNIFDAPEKLLEKAEEMDSKFCASAYYYRGVAAVLKYSSDKQPAAIEKAIKYFKMAKDALELKKVYIQTMIQITIPENSFSADETYVEMPKTTLHSQLERQITLITSLIHNIETLIGRNVKDDLDYLDKVLKNPLSNDEREKLEKQKNELKINMKSLEDGVLKPLEISKADITIESQPIVKVLPPSERAELFKQEIEQFEDDQFKTILIVKERPPINWWAFSIIAGAALLQIIGGASAALFSLGVGASVGFALLQEGVCDMIYAVKSGIINRNLNWVTYGIRKAISLTITMFSFGFGAIKAAAKGMASGAKAVGKFAIGAANRVTKEGLKLACKAVGRAVTLEVSKTAISSTMDYVCAETIEKGLSSLLETPVKQIFISQIGTDQNLLKLLQCDQKNGNMKYSAMFTQEVLGILNNSNFVKQMQDETMNIVNKISQVANDEIKLCGKVLKGIEASTILVKLGTIFESLSQTLSKIVIENQADIEKSLAKASASTNENGNYSYAQTQTLSIHDFLHSLSKQVSSIIVSELSGVAKQLAVNKISKGLNKWASSVHEEIGKYRESFIDSEIVLQSAEEKRETVTSKEGNETIDYIENVANDGPGDLRHAKHLSSVIEQPIDIHTVDENGVKQVIRVGDEYSHKPSIELHYERPSDGSNIGHYTLADGTPITSSGKNSCLFDAVSEKTKYEPDLLRRGVANVMLNRFESVQADIQHYKFSDLLVGGKASKKNISQPATSRPPRAHSPASTRHVAEIKDHADNVAKVQKAGADRGIPVPVNTVISADPTELDNSVDQDYKQGNTQGVYVWKKTAVVRENFMNGYVIERTETYNAKQ
uniref:Chloroplast protein-transporting ATPase n=1 Tax=Panagrolaimus davidi TaxID=227884 RepID=A0A914P6I6_9BILA